jgi:hypothetical protein
MGVRARRARRGKTAGSGQEADERRQRTAKASRQLPSASLGHCAALSFVVRGKGRCEIVDFIVF